MSWFEREQAQIVGSVLAVHVVLLCFAGGDLRAAGAALALGFVNAILEARS
jgi:hypothetical protein